MATAVILSSALLLPFICVQSVPTATDRPTPYPINYVPYPGAMPLECWDGDKTLFEGDTNGDVCNPCTCTNPIPGNLLITQGKLVCAKVSCSASLPCVDALKVKGKCCPICPNGPNCKHGKHIINVGEVYKPDANTQCSCPTGMAAMGTQGHEAKCTKI